MGEEDERESSELELDAAVAQPRSSSTPSAARKVRELLCLPTADPNGCRSDLISGDQVSLLWDPIAGGLEQHQRRGR